MGALMGLRPINPGLRTIHYWGVSTGKAQINVNQGDELTVPESVAEQLFAQSGQFKDGPAPVAGLTDTEREADKNAAEAREAIAAESGDELETTDAKPNKRRKS